MDDEAARGAVVALVIAIRDAGALRMWDQAQARLRVSAKLSRTVPEFATTLQRGMQSDPRRAVAKAMAALMIAAGDDPLPLLRMVDREHGYIIALAQLETERRALEAKERRQARAVVAAEGTELEEEPFDV